jgi:ribosomal protein S18 acetylase RimI-like enzyme
LSPSTPAIRPAITTDIHDVLDLWVRAAARPSATDTAPDLARVVDAPHAVVFVAVAENGLFVGSLIVTFDSWRGNFYRMAVAPEVRRFGIASRLARAGEEWLRHADAVRLSALVEGDREVAQAFWESVGFEHYAGMRRYSKNL